MNRGAPIVILLALLSLGLLSGAVIQERRLGHLRQRQKDLIQGLSQAAESAVAPVGGTPTAAPASEGTSAELLQLRNEVNRLARRKQELSMTRLQNQQLKEQLNAGATNRPALVPGYIRIKDAQMAGYQTPEATLQTFLWAIRNRDLTNMLQTLTPETVQRLNNPVAHQGLERFFEFNDTIPGLGIAETIRQPDGSMVVKLQAVPDVPTANVTFRLIGNQWKMTWPPQ